MKLFIKYVIFFIIIDIVSLFIVYYAHNIPPALSAKQVQEITVRAVSDHLSQCTKCQVEHDDVYGDTILPCDEYYEVIKKAHRIGNWVWCNKGWVKLSEHPELK